MISVVLRFTSNLVSISGLGFFVLILIFVPCCVLGICGLGKPASLPVGFCDFFDLEAFLSRRFCFFFVNCFARRPRCPKVAEAMKYLFLFSVFFQGYFFFVLTPELSMFERYCRMMCAVTAFREASQGYIYFTTVDYTVLVTLLRCIVNYTAYPIQELCGPFPQKQGLGLKGLGWRFLTLTERALKE